MEAICLDGARNMRLVRKECKTIQKPFITTKRSNCLTATNAGFQHLLHIRQT